MAVDSNKYSIYARQDADKKYVDWGKIAQDVTKGITTIAQQRKKRKWEFEQMTNKALESLSEVPDVQNQNAGALIINASDMSKHNLQLQYDLFKRGLISAKDLQLFMAQQKTDYSSYSTSIKNWDGWYQKSLERIDKELADPGEEYNMLSLEGFGNLQNKALLTNPANGKLQLVEMDRDTDGNFTVTPNAKTNPEKFISPNGINLRMNLQGNKKVLTAEVKKLVEPLGKFIREEISRTGTTITKEGLVYDDEGTYDEFMKSSVASLTATNNDQMQIMAGQGYKIAQSEDEYYRLYGEDADINKWMKISYEAGNPVYELNKGDIKTESEKIAKSAIDAQLDDILKKDKEMSSRAQGDADKLKLGEDRIKTIGEVYSSTDPEVVERAIKSLLTTSDDRFAEFDQVTVGEGDNAIVTEIIVPYIDGNNNKVSKPIKLHELKEGADEGSTDPNDYVAVSPAEFTQGMYEIISMGDARYVPYSDVQKFVDNELIINPIGKKSYKPTTQVYQDPREGITIESPIGSGTTLTNVKEIYTPTITTILGKSVNVSAENVAELANKMNEAIRQAAVQQKDDDAANRVKITNISDKSIEIQIEGEETKTTIKIPGAFEYDSSNLESQIDNVMNEVLKKILPAIEGGHGGTNTDPLEIN